MADCYRLLSSDHEPTRLEAASQLLFKLPVDEGLGEDKTKIALVRLIRGLGSGRESSRIGFATALSELIAQAVPNGDSDGSIIDLLDLFEKHLKITKSQTAQEQHDRYVGQLFGLQAIFESGLLFRNHGLSNALPRFVEDIYNLGQEKPWLREQCAWLTCSLPGRFIEHGAPRRKRWQKTLRLIVNFWCKGAMAMTPEGVAVWHLFAQQLELEEKLMPANVWDKKDVLDPSNLDTLAKVLKETTGSKIDNAREDLITVQKGSWSDRPHFVWDILFNSVLEDGRVLDFSKAKMNQAMSKQNGEEEDEEEESDNESEDEETPSITFEAFWKKTVDENLFSESATEERKYWGLQLFLGMIRNRPAKLLYPLLSPNLVRTIMYQLLDKIRVLNAISHVILDAMVSRASGDVDAAIGFVCGLASADGFLFFDKTTKTRTVDTLMSYIDDRRASMLGLLFQDLIDTPKTAEVEKAEKRREIMAEQLAECIKSGTGRSEKPHAVKEIVMQTLVTNGWLVDSRGKPIAVPQTDKTRQIFRDKTMAVLMEVMGQNVGDERGAATYPFAMLEGFTSQLRDKAGAHEEMPIPVFSEKGETDSKLVIEMDAEVRKIRDDATKIVTDIHEQRRVGQDTTQLEAFERLFSLAIVMLYNGDPDAAGLLEDLTSCYDTVVMLKDGPKQSAAADSGDRMVELLLTFLSKPSANLRKLAQQVFTAFVPQLGVGGLQILIDVLESSESLQGQQALFDKEPVDGDEDQGMQDADAMEDVVVDGGKLVTKGDPGSSGDSSSDSDADGEDSDVSMEDADEATDEANAQLDAALIAALGPAAAKPKSEADKTPQTNGKSKESKKETNGTTNGHLSSSSSSSSFSSSSSSSEPDSDSDMTDTEMFAQDIDSKLSNIFAHRRAATSSTKDKKKEAKTARENIVIFKNKVLDLIEAYLKTEFASPVAFQDGVLIFGLLRACRKSSAQQLRERIGKLSGNWCSRCKGKDMPTLDLSPPSDTGDRYIGVLRKIHTEAALLNTPPPHKKLCSQFSLLITKVLTRQTSGGAECVTRVLGVYMETWQGWLTGKGGKKRIKKGGRKGKQVEGVGVQAGLFSDFVSWSVSARETLGVVKGVAEMEEVVGRGSEGAEEEGGE